MAITFELGAVELLLGGALGACKALRAAQCAAERGCTHPLRKAAKFVECSSEKAVPPLQPQGKQRLEPMARLRQPPRSCCVQPAEHLRGALLKDPTEGNNNTCRDIWPH